MEGLIRGKPEPHCRIAGFCANQQTPDMKLLAPLLMAARWQHPALPAPSRRQKPGGAEPRPKLRRPSPIWSRARPALAVCAACHGADGNSGTPANPKLAQQHPEYLVKQLQEFKSGKRANAIMQGFASTLTDEDMKNIATGWPPRKPSPVLPKTRPLVTGRAHLPRRHRRPPDCRLRRLPQPQRRRHSAQYPRLSGQHADYTVAQLRRSAMACVPTAADDPGGRQAERPRNQGGADYIAGLR
jgi:cytochrome c553